MIQNKYKITFIFFLLFNLIAYGSFAGVIVLKSGEEIQGRILKKTEKYIEIKVKGRILMYDVEDVAHIKGRKPVATPKNYSDNAGVTFEIGLQAASDGFFLDAEKVFMKILVLEPKNPNVKEALEIIDDYRSKVIDSEYAQYIFKGAYYLLLKEYRQAISVYKKILEIKPSSPEVYYNMGTAYQGLGLADEAVKCFKKLIDINPQDYEVILKLGYAYYFLGDYHSSIFYLEKAIKLVANDPKPYSILGMNFYSIGQSKKAKNYLKKAKKIYLDSGNIKRAKEIGSLIETFI